MERPLRGTYSKSTFIRMYFMEDKIIHQKEKIKIKKAYIILEHVLLIYHENWCCYSQAAGRSGRKVIRIQVKILNYLIGLQFDSGRAVVFFWQFPRTETGSTAVIPDFMQWWIHDYLGCQHPPWKSFSQNKN